MNLAKDSAAGPGGVLDSIFDDTPVGIAVVDQSGHFVRVNHEAERLIGFVRNGDASGGFVCPAHTQLRSDGSVLTAADCPCARALRDRVRVWGEEIGLLREDGNLVWVSISVMPEPLGGAVVFYQDVTARRQHDDIHSARGRLIELATSCSMHDLLQATLDEAEVLTGSLVGFYHFLDEDQVTLSLQAWSTRTTREFCKAEGKGRHYDVALAGVWVDCIHQRRAVVHNDYASLAHKKGLPPGHAPVSRLLTVPVMRGGRIKALLGVGNKPKPYGLWDVEKVQYLAHLAWDIAERRRAEEALYLKEAALESSLNAVALSDLDGRLHYVNDATVKLWGFANRREPLGRHLAELFADPGVAASVTAQVAAGACLHSELHARRSDGSIFDVEFTASLVRDRNGMPVGLLGVFLDATERHRTEAALRRSEERFELAFKVLPDAVYISERNSGHFLEVNPGFERMSGFTRAEVLGKNVNDLGLFPNPEDRDRYRQILTSEGRVRGFVSEIRDRNGKPYWAETSTDQITLDGQPCLLSSSRDITDRVASEAALRNSEARFRSMFETHDAIMLLVDPETGTILDANQAAQRYYGYPSPGPARMTIRDLATASPDDVRATMDRAMRGTLRSFQFRHRLASGEIRDVEIHSSPIDFGGRPVLFSIIHDISERRQLEERVRQAQRMESLGSLAGGVAHDMNNVLAAILGITSLLLEDDPERLRAKDYETIIQACLRGRTMVRGLLDFTRQELVDLQPLDLNLLIKEQAHLVGRNLASTLHLDLQLAPDLRRIRGDASALGRSIMNLVVNALDALGNMGRITIHTRNLEGEMVELVVQDDGPGMTKDVLDKALDPFFTTKPVGKGTGLGLAIVYGTVKAHRGQLELASQPGQGVRVSLRFPASESTPNLPQHTHPSLDPPKAESLDVLLVDDDPLIQSTVSAMLRRLGHRVTVAPNGAVALRILESAVGCSLVILDLNMPVLDGRGTLPRLRELRPSLPVLIATGRADETAHELARAHPGVSILSKPFSYEELKQQIEVITRQLGPRPHQ
jgi:two-component system, cell cycle sensor histidine kinase and response regulator CckA